MIRLFAVLSFICLLSTLSAQTTFSVQPEESPCRWVGSAAVGLYQIEGSLEVASGGLLVQGDSLLEASLMIDMKSLDTENKTVKKHLKGKDFFAVNSYPEARFVLEKQVLLRDGPGTVTGMIEVRGIAKPKEVPMEIEVGKKEILIKGVLVLDRTEFGITYNSSNFFEDLGDQAISDEIAFHFNLVFERD